MKLALISPNKDAYSETFIQQHKKHLDADVKFYYGGFLPMYLEEEGYLKPSFANRLICICKRILGINVPDNYLRTKSLEKSFKNNGIKVVYAEYGQSGVAVMDICRKYNIPLIVNFHGYDISEKNVLAQFSDRYKELFVYASYIVAVSKVMKQKLLDMGCNADKIVYTPCAPDDSFFKITPTYTEDAFLAVGRFVEKKAPYYTILAFKRVVDKYPQAKLYMVGKGELWESCRNIVRYFKLEDNVYFLGAVMPKDIMKYYSTVRAFVQHSITAENGDMEGTPVAVLEASAAGVPVVSTKHAGIQDVIIDDKTGFLVNEHDVDAMAERMLLLLDDSNLAETIGQAGRSNTKEKYSLKIHIDTLNKAIANSL